MKNIFFENSDLISAENSDDLEFEIGPDHLPATQSCSTDQLRHDFLNLNFDIKLSAYSFKL